MLRCKQIVWIIVVLFVGFGCTIGGGDSEDGDQIVVTPDGDNSSVDADWNQTPDGDADPDPVFPEDGDQETDGDDVIDGDSDIDADESEIDSPVDGDTLETDSDLQPDGDLERLEQDLDSESCDEDEFVPDGDLDIEPEIEEVELDEEIEADAEAELEPEMEPEADWEMETDCFEFDWEPDEETDEPLVPCSNNTECNDDVVCTLDMCFNGYCYNLIDHSLCSPGEVCSRSQDCQPAAGRLCESCSVTLQNCPRSNDVCAPANGSMSASCLLPCDSYESCPPGFTCNEVAISFGVTRYACEPDNHLCCLDEDEDGAGIGVDCAAFDCDETDGAIREGVAESCDGVDNNCDGSTDEGENLCPAAHCDGNGQDGYTVYVASSCEEGQCSTPTGTPCGAFSCIGGGSVGDICATSCTDEQSCIDGAACQQGVCVAVFQNGSPCVYSSNCESGHCQNGYCCSAGDCCSAVQNCPEDYSRAPACDTPETCQGSRLDAQCVDYQCSSVTVDDDSGCTALELARSCEWFADLYCNGQLDQDVLQCPETCSSNWDCDSGAHCDEICVADLPNGAECDEVSDCESAHCQNGYCCASGDCCDHAAHCPESYAEEAICDNHVSCQGHRRDATCIDGKCGSIYDIEDDSACDSSIVSKTCGYYQPATCNGDPNQSEPSCPTFCQSDSQCVEQAHCDGQCQLDFPSGSPCDEDSDCESGHCQNGFCCAAGDCCYSAANCPAGYSQSPVCDDTATCQGHRNEAACVNNICQTGSALDDDRGCTGSVLAKNCGYYLPRYCSGSTVQSEPQCPVSCTGDSQCIGGAHCQGGLCVPDQGIGQVCSGTDQCSDGLYCIDGVCCSSVCDGLCRRCDLPGREGICSNIAYGDDPDLECGLVTCGGYYYGWEDNICYRAANVSGADVSCNGQGSCQTAADLCLSQPRGVQEIVCNETCQQPDTGTCTGTSIGECNNLDLGNLTCGTGACQRTVPACENGAANVCVPGNPGNESCNNIDDDCDGVVDNHISSAEDNYEPNETASTAYDLGTVATDANQESFPGTIYPAGDVDYLMFYAHEVSSICVPFTNESFTIEVLLTPPTGEDCVDYDLVLYDADGNYLRSSSLSGCATETIQYTWAGVCTQNDSRYFKVRIRPWEDAWECESYTLFVDWWQN